MDSVKLTISVLGKLQIRINDEPLADFASVKAQALLVYLALQGHPVSRSRLAGLLWGDMPEEAARANLRLVLNKLNKPFAPFLDVSRNEIGLERSNSIWIDAEDFAQGIAQAETLELTTLQTILDLYRGAFLYDFSVRDAPEFELWLVETREHLQAIALRGSLIAARRAGEVADYTAGIRAARQAVALDPYNEEAHRTLMLLLAQGGQRGAALQHYESCQYMFLEDLGIAPAPETTQLYEKIHSGEIGTQGTLTIQHTEKGSPSGEQAAPLRSLPHPVTPLIGRSNEMTHILSLLDKPECRLITLTGLGGMGKTRLAIGASQHYADVHPNRSVVFVSLAGHLEHPDTSADELSDLLASRIAESLRLACPITQNLQEEVLACLALQDLLLILDNFEELQSAAGWVSRILEVAPHITLLITSQVRLAIQGEWVIPIDGLPLTESINLFLKTTEPMQQESSMGDSQTAIQRICELVEGSPLAIELASQWIRTIPVSEIAQRLTNSLDLLQTTTRIVPKRQQNMRTVFEYTWRMLKSTEQATFSRLSIFRGGVDLAAAEQIAGATVPILNTLREHSLIRHEAGRYYLHELLRQFGAEKLQESPAASEIHARMSAFYADFLAKRAHVFTDELQYEAEQTPVIESIDRDIDNLRAALEWQIDNGTPSALMAFLEVLWSYFQRKGWYSEALTWLTRIAEKAKLNQGFNDFQRAWLSQRIGIANYEMGYTANSLTYFQQALGWLGYMLPKDDGGWRREALAQIIQQGRHRLGAKRAPKTDQRYADEAATNYYYLARIYFLSNTLLPYLVATIRCVNLAEAAGTTTNLSGYYGALALLVGGIGLHRLAARYTKLARQSLPANRTWRAQASAFEEFGLYAFLRGRWAEAQTFLMDAVRYYERANLTRYAGEDLALAANACFHQAKVTEAQQVYAQFVQMTGVLSDPRALIWEPMMTCQGALRLGNFPIGEIIQNLTSFESAHHNYLSTQDTIRLHALLAMAYLRAGQYLLAEQYVTSGLELALRDQNLTMYLTDGLGNLTEVCLSLWEGNPQRKHLATLTKRGCRQLQSLVRNFPGARVQWQLCQGGVEWLSGHRQQALHEWQSGLRDAENLVMPYEQARFCLELGRHNSDPAATDDYLKRCCDLCLAYGFSYELSWARSLRTQNRVNLTDWKPATAALRE